jgi:hypothetical protein
MCNTMIRPQQTAIHVRGQDGDTFANRLAVHASSSRLRLFVAIGCGGLPGCGRSTTDCVLDCEHQMISVRSFRGLTSRILAAVRLCIAVASMAAFPALAQDQTAPPAPPPQPSSQTQKAATRIDLSASSSTSEARSAVTFAAAVTGEGGTPTGTVIFKDGEIVLGSVTLSERRARLTTSALAAGRRTIVATYSGDDAFEGSVSAALPHEVVKAATTIELTASATEGEARTEVTFTAEVASAGGTPAGTVTFKDADRTLGEATLADGRASFFTSALPQGRHSITAVYGGGAIFAPSTSQPLTYRIRQSTVPPENVPAVLVLLAILLAAFIVLALLALFRRLASRWLLRPLSRWLRALSTGLRRVLRFGRQAPTRERPLKSLLGQSVGGMVFTETEDAIAADFDKSSVQINPQFRLGCSWIQPVLGVGHREGSKEDSDRPDEVLDKTKEDADKTKEDLEKAREDFEKARHLFRADVPTDANPLNLYEDIHNAFIVRLFGRSDKPCFYVLSEFGRVISANVFCLAIVFSCVATAVAFVNFAASDLVPFHLILISLPTELNFLGIDISPFLRTVRDFSTGFDKFVFAALSCLLGFVVMLMFYQLAYQQLQTLNGQQMDKFLMSYLKDIQVEFGKINASANAAIIGEKEADEMRAETVMWITNLQWMTWRVFFIEEFLRNIWFQIRRDSIYSLVLVPLLFIFLLILPPVTASAVGILELNYSQLSFYLLFPILLYWCYRYLTGSLAPVSNSLTRQWPKVRQLDSVHELNRIMGAYAGQLVQWRSRFQGPGNQ